MPEKHLTLKETINFIDQITNFVRGFRGASMAPPSQTDGLGNTDLHLAAKDGKLKEVETELEKHPHFIDYTNHYGRTPLMAAITGNKSEEDDTVKGQIGVINHLLNNGANYEAPVEPVQRSFTPLMAAAQRGNAEMVTILLRAGADPAAQPEGYSPTSVFPTTEKCGTALEFARSNNNHEAAQLIKNALVEREQEMFFPFYL